MLIYFISAYPQTIDYINGKSHADVRLSGYNKLKNLLEAFRKKKFEIMAVKEPKTLSRKADFLISLDHPYLSKSERLHIIGISRKRLLIQVEPEAVRPINWQKETYEIYDHILTWNDELVDDKKFIKFYPVSVDWNPIPFDYNRQEIMFSMVAANKSSSYKNELYSERRKIINFFESESSRYSFVLHGPGWDEFVFNMDIFPIYYLNTRYFKFFRKAISFKKLNNWKGTISDKSDILSVSRFHFAFENMRGSMGYILEKIFEPMLCGSIPIYLGAENIERYIPEDCFIDYRKFSNIEKLAEHCASMGNNEIKKYRENIALFLQSKKAEVFKDEPFTELIMGLIIEK